MNPSSRWLVREEGRGEREGTYRRGPGGDEQTELGKDRRGAKEVEC